MELVMMAKILQGGFLTFVWIKSFTDPVDDPFTGVFAIIKQLSNLTNGITYFLLEEEDRMYDDFSE